MLGIGLDPADAEEHDEVLLQVLSWFSASDDEWNVKVRLRPKIEVQQNIFRTPDLALLRNDAAREKEQELPLLVVEIISNENFGTLAKMVDEYIAAGIQTVWLIDPRTRTACWCTRGGWFKVPIHGRLQVAGNPIYLELEAKIPSWAITETSLEPR